jgi:hypothetical protein
MPDVNLTVTPPVDPLILVTPATVFVNVGNVVGAVGAGTSQFSVQGTGNPGNPYQLVGDASAPGTWEFYGTNGSGVKGWLAQGASTQFSLIGIGVPGTPLQLNGDVASPGNNQYYGTNSGGTRGFYALPSTNVADSIQGNGTPGTPYELVGDVTTPSNGQFYGYSGSARGWFTPPNATATTAGYVPTPPNNVTTFLRGDATFATPPSATATVAGYVPTPPNNTTTFLRGDATFATPPSATATVAGYVPTPPNNTTTFLRGDATFAAVTGTAETLIATNLGTVGTNQTVNCAGACAVHINLIMSAAITLTLTNLLEGVPVSIAVASTGSFTIKMAASDPSSNTYAITEYNGGSTINMVTTGVAFSSTNLRIFVGNSYGGGSPTLQLGMI